MTIDLLPELLGSVLLFATTNVDDLLVIAALFADPRLRPRSIVLEQFLGIGVLVLVSALAALAAVAVPARWVALLGLAPLALGVRELVRQVRRIGRIEGPTQRRPRLAAQAIARS